MSKKFKQSTFSQLPEKKDENTLSKESNHTQAQKNTQTEGTTLRRMLFRLTSLRDPEKTKLLTVLSKLNLSGNNRYTLERVLFSVSKESSTKIECKRISKSNPFFILCFCSLLDHLPEQWLPTISTLLLYSTEHLRYTNKTIPLAVRSLSNIHKIVTRRIIKNKKSIFQLTNTMNRLLYTLATNSSLKILIDTIISFDISDTPSTIITLLSTLIYNCIIHQIPENTNSNSILRSIYQEYINPLVYSSDTNHIRYYTNIVSRLIENRYLLDDILKDIIVHIKNNKNTTDINIVDTLGICLKEYYNTDRIIPSDTIKTPLITREIDKIIINRIAKELTCIRNSSKIAISKVEITLRILSNLLETNKYLRIVAEDSRIISILIEAIIQIDKVSTGEIPLNTDGKEKIRKIVSNILSNSEAERTIFRVLEEQRYTRKNNLLLSSLLIDGIIIKCIRENSNRILYRAKHLIIPLLTSRSNLFTAQIPYILNILLPEESKYLVNTLLIRVKDRIGSPSMISTENESYSIILLYKILLPIVPYLEYKDTLDIVPYFISAIDTTMIPIVFTILNRIVLRIEYLKEGSFSKLEYLKDIISIIPRVIRECTREVLKYVYELVYTLGTLSINRIEWIEVLYIMIERIGEYSYGKIEWESKVFGLLHRVSSERVIEKIVSKRPQKSIGNTHKEAYTSILCSVAENNGLGLIVNRLAVEHRESKLLSRLHLVSVLRKIIESSREKGISCRNVVPVLLPLVEDALRSKEEKYLNNGLLLIKAIHKSSWGVSEDYPVGVHLLNLVVSVLNKKKLEKTLVSVLKSFSKRLSLNMVSVYFIRGINSRDKDVREQNLRLYRLLWEEVSLTTYPSQANCLFRFINCHLSKDFL
ncbi:hypothetical protein NEOKW01_1160 [Nematocida sp. AWRm80]|nr:hypothetical protein NEOKW01_1160 [Nematocida sp. AWRm80]